MNPNPTPTLVTIHDAIKLRDPTKADEFSEVRVEYLESLGFNVIGHGHEEFFTTETGGWRARKEWTNTLETLLREELRSTFEKVDTIKKMGVRTPMKNEEKFERAVKFAIHQYKKCNNTLNLSENNTHRETRFDLKNGEKYREAYQLLNTAQKYGNEYGGFTSFYILVEVGSGDIPLAEAEQKLHDRSWEDKRVKPSRKKQSGIIRHETREEANTGVKEASERVPNLISEIRENSVVENDPHFQHNPETPEPLGATY